MTEQQTLQRPVTYKGRALHAGIPVSMRLLPAPPDTGIVFRRLDLPGEPEIPAIVENIVDTKRNTTLGIGPVRVMTVEHLIAALRGLGVDNAVVELDAGETPMGDGSARVFVDVIRWAGLCKQGVPRRYYRLQHPVWVSQGASHIVALPADALIITYTFVTDHPVVGIQFGEYMISSDVFAEQLASARTLVFRKDIEALQQQGLGLGGDFDCVVVVGEDRYYTPLRFPDEIVRHKILDVVGDMGFLGFLQAHIIAVRSGHALNARLVRKIRQQERRMIEVGSR